MAHDRPHDDPTEPTTTKEATHVIPQPVADAFNAQLNRELYSSYFYLAQSAYGESLGLRGVAKWFLAKHDEELVHAMKFYRYLVDQDAAVQLGEIAAPRSEFGGVVDAFEQTLAHERQVTRSIHDLIDVARDNRDHASEIFLHWFVTEQIEEEAVVNDILGRLRLVGDGGEGLYLVDKELAQLAAANAAQAGTA
jgi:ferritin